MKKIYKNGSQWTSILGIYVAYNNWYETLFFIKPQQKNGQQRLEALRGIYMVNKQVEDSSLLIIIKWCNYMQINVTSPHKKKH